MKRFLAYLILLCFAACTPVTTTGPGEQSDASRPRRDAQTQQLDDNDAPQPTAANNRFAQPPGDAPAEWHEAAPSRTGASDRLSETKAEPANEMRADKGRRAAPAPATKSPNGIWGADSSSPGDASGAARSAAPMHEGGGAQPLAKKAERDYDDQRPGLGTSWGETRSSQVYETTFERDSTTPSYTATLSYNDRRGASALAGGNGYASYASVGMSSALTVSLRDNYGSTLPAYRGNGRTVAVGENGQRYTIVVQNNTNERFEVVMSVDGLDVLDGEDASYNKRGYLIDPYGTLEIEGFRQSADAVAAFRFGSVSDSYAARTGSARNVGVIGVAAFGERGYAYRLHAYQERMAAQRYSNRELDRRRNADPFPAKWAEPPREPLTIAR